MYTLQNLNMNVGFIIKFSFVIMQGKCGCHPRIISTGLGLALSPYPARFASWAEPAIKDDFFERARLGRQMRDDFPTDRARPAKGKRLF